MKKLILGILLLTLPQLALAGLWLDVEGGMIFPGYNDVGVPGDTGTRFSLKDDLPAASGPFWRVRAGIELGGGHELSLLVAPLSTTATGSVGSDILFGGKTFTAGTDLEGLYRFNSYRLTYTYRFQAARGLRLAIGFTAKIRDAEIKLEGGGQSASTENVGFVPLINLGLEWRLSPWLEFLIEGDALVGPGGRAEDIFSGFRFTLSPHLQLKAGYRFVEGGADNDTVYNFTLIHYLAGGIILRI